MANFIAPGVYTREIDRSLYAPQLSTTIVGMVGLAKKGKVNVPTLIANMNQFIEKFGAPVPDFVISDQGEMVGHYYCYDHSSGRINFKISESQDKVLEVVVDRTGR